MHTQEVLAVPGKGEAAKPGGGLLGGPGEFVGWRVLCPILQPSASSLATALQASGQFLRASQEAHFPGSLAVLASHCLPLLPHGGGSLQPGPELGTRLGLKAPPGSYMTFASDPSYLSLGVPTWEVWGPGQAGVGCEV